MTKISEISISPNFFTCVPYHYHNDPALYKNLEIKSLCTLKRLFDIIWRTSENSDFLGQGRFRTPILPKFSVIFCAFFDENRNHPSVKSIRLNFSQNLILPSQIDGFHKCWSLCSDFRTWTGCIWYDPFHMANIAWGSYGYRKTEFLPLSALIHCFDR